MTTPATTYAEAERHQYSGSEYHDGQPFWTVTCHPCKAGLNSGHHYRSLELAQRLADEHNRSTHPTQDHELTEDQQTDMWELATEYATDRVNTEYADFTGTGDEIEAALDRYTNDRYADLEALALLAAGADRRIRQDKKRQEFIAARKHRNRDRCLICGNDDESYLTESSIVVYAAPSRNPDPTGLAGFDPDADIGSIKINACLICIGELQTGTPAIVSLADNPAYEDGLEAARQG